ncbi:MAG: putative Ig domain-containing protein, partial [Candidatus Vogelbacteria bacterium]|nr:putative Ig domain-containing protein [Candidatus Vogelbacteria bacterium]
LAREKISFTSVEGIVDPEFDEELASSVVKFQVKYGITPRSGYVGPLTRAKLNALYRCGITCPQYTPPAPGWCFGGTILPPEPRADGCRGVARCVMPNQITINSVSGPNSLNVGQTGTWAVNATAPSGSNLTYSVDWGYVVYPATAGANSAIIKQTSTFTHSYSQAGTYTVKFTVSAPSNSYLVNHAETSLTVVVGGGTRQNLSITYPADPANWHDFVGETFSKVFTVRREVNPTKPPYYTWSITSGALPSGLSLINPMIVCEPCIDGQYCPPCPNGSNQVYISGTPTRAGNFPFTLTVRDDLGNTGSIGLTINIEGNMVALKPVIYLYPQKTQAVKVQLDYAGKLIADYPAYDQKIGGWEVTASPDGKLINKADGKEYSYLFWEGNDYNQTNYDLTTGSVVKGSDTRAFLQDALSKMGLTPKEYNEFIVYWYPKMENNAYNLIHFAGQEYTDKAKLTISPTPDSVLRVFMVFKPLIKCRLKIIVHKVFVLFFELFVVRLSIFFIF